MPYRLHQFNSFRSINQHDRKTDYEVNEISADGSGERGTVAFYLRQQAEVPAAVQVMVVLERAPVGRTENGKPDMDGGGHVPRTDPGDLPAAVSGRFLRAAAPAACDRMADQVAGNLPLRDGGKIFQGNGT